MSLDVKHPVKTTEKSFKLLEVMKSTNSKTITELSNEVDMGISAIHNHLNTLRELGYVIKKGNEYKISLKFLDFGGYTRSQMKLFKVAEPEIEQLANETGELANLLVEENGKGIHLKRSKGEQALDLDSYLGMRSNLTTTSLGKAILAHLPEERAMEILDQHGIPPLTNKSITNKGDFMEHLEEIREQGYAVDDGERSEGLRCVAAPIQTSHVHGAISVSAPATRISDEQLKNEISGLVISSANVIELNMKH